MPGPQNVGDQIVRICREYAVSRYWIANKLGVQESLVSRWARNLTRASVMDQAAIDAMEKQLRTRKRRTAGRGEMEEGK